MVTFIIIRKAGEEIECVCQRINGGGDMELNIVALNHPIAEGWEHG